MKVSKKEYIKKLAEFLVSTETTMNISDLANHLNWNNFRTKDRKPYKGKRGTYVLVKSTWKWLEKNKMKNEAEQVAKAFVTPSNKYAYK
jgi:hypothetical protein